MSAKKICISLLVFAIFISLLASPLLAAQEEYCEVSGNKDYNIMGVVTEGAKQNIIYFDKTGKDGKKNYYHYTKERVKLGSAKNFTLTVTQKNKWSRSYVWIDWNGDGQFDQEKELVAQYGKSDQLNETPFRSVIDIPEDVLTGKPFRMRIQSLDAWIKYYSPCGEVWYSFTKDFDLEK